MSRQPVSRRAALIITLVVVLVPVAGLILASIVGGGGFFERYPNVHYIIAFAVGATLTVLLSVGLFSLMFMSARRGFDGEVTLEPKPGEENEARPVVNAPEDSG